MGALFRFMKSISMLLQGISRLNWVSGVIKFGATLLTADPHFGGEKV